MAWLQLTSHPVKSPFLWNRPTDTLIQLCWQNPSIIYDLETHIARLTCSSSTWHRGTACTKGILPTVRRKATFSNWCSVVLPLSLTRGKKSQMIHDPTWANDKEKEEKRPSSYRWEYLVFWCRGKEYLSQVDFGSSRQWRVQLLMQHILC